MAAPNPRPTAVRQKVLLLKSKIMISISAKIREVFGKKVKDLREQGILPAILYGQKAKETALSLELKEFKKVFQSAGESSLITLDIEGRKEKNMVMIHAVAFDPLTGEPIHADFYQPDLTEKIEVKVPLIFEGESLAIKELGGTLVKNIHELEVKALPQNLPHAIIVDVSVLNTFEDRVLVKDLVVSDGVEILKDPEEVVVMVDEPQKAEEEIEKPIEDKVAEIKKAGEKEEEKEEG